MWYLYTITNQVNGKQYIGISSQPARRWIEHKCGHGSKLVYQAIKKYSLENLRFDPLYMGCEEEIKQLEVILIAACETMAPDGYNLTEGGEGSTGWKPSIETRRKMSKTHSGKNNAMYGRKHSKETKKKIAKKAKARKWTEEHCKKNSRPGSKNPKARKVLVNNKKYDCIKDAAEVIGIKAATLRARLSRYNKTGNWPPGWRYLD
jgi:group I intron endonuclease